MEKLQLDIVGLSYSQTQSGAYALVLGESEGKRRLPIIIGGFEAQAIAIELENMTPTRPLTHDLFKSFAESFSINVKEVIVYNLIEGIFYSKIICMQDGKEIEIDARTSDAIAIAVRLKCPVYTFEFILSSAGILLDEETDQAITSSNVDSIEEEDTPKTPSIHSKSDKELEEDLNDAINEEDYEKASKIRDELNRRNPEDN